MERACFGCLLFSEALRLPRGPSETNGCNLLLTVVLHVFVRFVLCGESTIQPFACFVGLSVGGSTDPSKLSLRALWTFLALEYSIFARAECPKSEASSKKPSIPVSQKTSIMTLHIDDRICCVICTANSKRLMRFFGFLHNQHVSSVP